MLWGTPIIDSKGRPLCFTVTGGQVYDSQVVEEILNTTRSPLAVTADKADDSEIVRQQIRDEGALLTPTVRFVPPNPLATVADLSRSPP
jgi:hypothetical protein